MKNAVSLFGVIAIGLPGVLACEPPPEPPPIPGTSCIVQSENLSRLPFDIFLVVDRSGSMSARWNDTVAALKSFFTDPESGGIGVGLNLFPSSDPRGVGCSPENFNPTQSAHQGELAVLPRAMSRLNVLLDANVGGGTPMYGALFGTYQAVEAHMQRFPDNTVIVVVSGDGAPGGGGCQTYYESANGPGDYTSISAVSGLAADAYANLGIETYAIAVDANATQALNAVAASGGTQNAIDVSTDNSLFLERMVDIRDSIAVDRCTYAVPTVNGTFAPGKVNIEYIDANNQRTPIPYRQRDLACSSAPGWYFDDPAQPQFISLCPASCTEYTSTPAALISFVYGCDTGSLEG